MSRKNRKSVKRVKATEEVARQGALSVRDLALDPLTPVATKYWSPGQEKYAKYDASIIEDIYYNEIRGSDMGSPRIVMLELSSYLECYLWPNFNAETATYAHIMSIIHLLNEKFRENLMGVWNSLVSLRDDETLFNFFKTAQSMYPLFEVGSGASSVSEIAKALLSEMPQRLESISNGNRNYIFSCERTQYLLLFTNALASLEHPTLRRSVAAIVSLPLWRALRPESVEAQLLIYPELASKWKRLLKLSEHKGPEDKFRLESDIIPSFLRTFFHVLYRVGTAIRSTRAKTATSEVVKALYNSTILNVPLMTDLLQSDAQKDDKNMEHSEDEDESEAEEQSKQKNKKKGTAGKKSAKQGGRKQKVAPKSKSDPFKTLRLSWETKAKKADPFSGFNIISEVRADITYLERSLELYTDLLSQLPTRRFTKALLADLHFVTRCELSLFANAYDRSNNRFRLLSAEVNESTKESAINESTSDSDSDFDAVSEDSDNDGDEMMDGEVDPDTRNQQDVEISSGTKTSRAESDAKSSGESSTSESDSSSVSDSDSDSGSDTDTDADTDSESESESGTDAENAVKTKGTQKGKKSFGKKMITKKIPVGKPIHLARCSNKLFKQLVKQLSVYYMFEIDDKTGATRTARETAVEHLSRIQRLQRSAFKLYSSTLDELILATSKSLATKESLLKHLDLLSTEQLVTFADDLQVSLEASKTVFPDLDLLVEDVVNLKETTGEPLSKRKLSASNSFREFALTALANVFAQPISTSEAVQALPLYPTEQALWDENVVPSSRFRGKTCLALPKLSIQFLSAYDYLLRCFTLYRMESAYEIREQMLDVLMRMNPIRVQTESSEPISSNFVQFTGRSQYGIPIRGFQLRNVKPPALGSTIPQQVRGEITVDLSLVPHGARGEWESIRESDVFFLVTVVPQQVNEGPQEPLLGTKRNRNLMQKRAPELSKKIQNASAASKAKLLGIRRVRGCEVVCVLDERQRVVGERDPESGKVYTAFGNIRTFVVNLDCAQYHIDMQQLVAEETDNSDDSMAELYASFNVLIRRRAEENSFKSMLQTMREIMLEGVGVPEWLQEVFLGFGDPASATHSALPNRLNHMKFSDTFVSREHLRDSFPDSLKIEFEEPESKTMSPDLVESFDVSFEKVPPQTNLNELHEKLRRLLPKYQGNPQIDSNLIATSVNNGDLAEEKVEDDDNSPEKPTLVIKPYPRTQLRDSTPKRNTVRFTPVQVEAIKSGVNPGLTLIVGPPGTGKTDTAVQILSELYHNFPNERIILVTHSNHALNDLFTKLMQRDVDERYLLRLGYAGAELETEQDFSKFGRVNHMLQRRLDLLQTVKELGRSLNVVGDIGSTCETAGIFRTQHILPRIKVFSEGLEEAKERGIAQAWEFLKSSFPFSNYFSSRRPIAYQGTGESGSMVDSNQPYNGTIFHGTSFDEDFSVAKSCLERLEVVFQHLEETRPFELLRTFKDRGDHLVAQHAKVIAMTCAHAAIRRSHFIKLGLQYDTLVMEEAAQALDIETFIPMTLQPRDKEFGNRLKRVVLLGDHNQLPPIVQNRALQQYSRLEQSLFARFMRLGYPAIQLNAQGRMRPELAELWNWRYESLLDLPLTQTDIRFAKANCGMAHEFQLIDVGEESVETCPQPHFYQNLGEAEYLVHTYMYMRLMGIPAARISILTTYNGQKALLQDVLQRRCLGHPLLGLPAHVSTVDKFQGQQNDFVLLSLVRSQTVGHIRDVRRLVVALSRARLGLYVFAKAHLFQNAFELARPFALLASNPTKLKLCPSERNIYGMTPRPSAGECLKMGLAEDAYIRSAGSEQTSDEKESKKEKDTESNQSENNQVVEAESRTRVPTFTIENLPHLGIVVDRLRRAAEEEYRVNYEAYRAMELEIEKQQKEKVRRAEEARRREREMLEADEEEARREVERERALERITEQYEAELNATADN